LATLLVSKRSDLFGGGQIDNASLGALLDKGSFSCIYSNQQNNNSVVKVSRYGVDTELKREADVLTTLKNGIGGDTTSTGIVRLLSHEKLIVRVGGVDRILRANILSPRGVLIERILPLDPNERSEQLLKCGGVLKSALDYLHGHGYTHNDISPSNIMCEIGKSGQPFLIDFGLATKKKEMVLRKFQGTPRYAHSDIFQKHRSSVPWCGKPTYDFASLAFSMATLFNVKTRRPWARFQPSDMNPNGSDRAQARWHEFIKWVDYRSDEAQNLLRQAGFDKEWLKWCNDKITEESNHKNKRPKQSQL
jgi:serine/threonine protein kinase